MPYGSAIAGGISAIGSIAGGLIGGNSAQAAAKTQAAAEQQAVQLQQQQLQQTEQNLTPYLNNGTNALANLQYALGTSTGVPGASTNQTPLSAYLSAGGSTTLANGYKLVAGPNGTYNMVDKNGNMNWANITPNTPISDLEASAGQPGVQATSNSQGVSPAIAQNVQNGFLTQPFNGGQPFQFTPGQSGLTGTGLSTPVAPGQQPAYGQAGYGSPTVNPNGTLQAPGAFSYAAYQTPAPFTAAPFTFGQNQTGIPTAGSAQANGLPDNSGVGTAGVGANGIATYNAPAPFNYTAADFTASPGYAYTLGQTQNSTQNLAAAQGGAYSGNLLRALQTNAAGLSAQDFNSQEQLAQNAYGLNSQNSLNAFAQNYNTAQSGYDTNYNSALGQYTINAQTGLAGYNTNFNNALNTYDTNLNAGVNTYNTNYGNAQNTFNTSFNQQMATQAQLYAMLSGQAGSGQNAAVQQGGFGANAVGQQVNALTGAANATAAGQIGQANALTGAITGVGNSLGTQALLSPNYLQLYNNNNSSATSALPAFSNSTPTQQISTYDPQYAFGAPQQQQSSGGF